MYDEMLMMIFSFSIKQIVNKIICHKENLKQTTRDHHCKWVKWTLQTQDWSLHSNSTSHILQKIINYNIILTWQSEDKSLKLNNDIVTHESEGNLFKFNYTHHHKTMKQIVQIQYENIITSVKQTISKFNDHIIIRKWNKPLKFNTTFITRESDANFSNSTPTLSWQENEINHSNLITTISSSMSKKNHLNLIPTSSSSQEIETNSWNVKKTWLS